MLSELDLGIGLRLANDDPTAFLKPRSPTSHKRRELIEPQVPVHDWLTGPEVKLCAGDDDSDEDENHERCVEHNGKGPGSLTKSG